VSADFRDVESFPLPAAVPQDLSRARELDDARALNSATYVQSIIHREERNLTDQARRVFLCTIHEVCAAHIAAIDAQWATRRPSSKAPQVLYTNAEAAD